jgi:hypothetical protein
MKEKTLKLWAYVNAAHRGFYWQLQKIVYKESASLDLGIARDDEPRACHSSLPGKNPNTHPMSAMTASLSN